MKLMTRRTGMLQLRIFTKYKIRQSGTNLHSLSFLNRTERNCALDRLPCLLSLPTIRSGTEHKLSAHFKSPQVPLCQLVRITPTAITNFLHKVSQIIAEKSYQICLRRWLIGSIWRRDKQTTEAQLVLCFTLADVEWLRRTQNLEFPHSLVSTN